MNMSIDRIENGIAVLVMRDDPPVCIHLPVSLLPPGCVQGDVLTLTLERDREATAAAKERVSGLLERIKKVDRV